MKLLKDISGFEQFYLCTLGCVALVFLAMLLGVPVWGSIAAYISDDPSIFSGFSIFIGLGIVFVTIPAAFVVVLTAPVMIIPEVWRLVTKHITPKSNPWLYVRIAIYLGSFFVALKVLEFIFSTT